MKGLLNTVILFVAIIFIAIVPFSSKGQMNNPGSNAIYLKVAGSPEIRGTIVAAYEHFFIDPNGLRFIQLGVGFEAGMFGVASWSGDNYNGNQLALRVVGLTGRKKSHIEFASGIKYFMETGELGEKKMLPVLDIGYRYQNFAGGFVFRTGVSLPEGVYLSFGYNF